jgi:hypothetical protein
MHLKTTDRNPKKTKIAYSKSCLLAAALILFAASAGFGSIVEGVKFDQRVETEKGTLELRGAGLLRYMVFIKAYVGALYLPETTPSSAVLTDIPKHLVIEYFHAIDGEAFGPAAIKTMEKNIDAETLARLKPKIEYHNSLYKDVKPGDRYSLTYLPGQGTTLRLNGEILGTVEGSDFAEAMFSVWLGPEPIGDDFKRAILGAG